jgi:oligopeptide/dipeptide ABC transporter ATP-binding protein
LSVERLGVSFSTDQGLVRAVDDVSYTVADGEILGMVGESGSGKSVSTRALVQLLPGSARLDPASSIRLRLGDGEIVDVASLGRRHRRLRHIRGGEIAMIFQEPMASFAPTYRIGDPIMEAARLHRGLDKTEARRVAIDLLERVGISEPQRRVDQYPFELSGGMRQRAMIAVALASRPRLLIADEPTTALDVTIQAQILDLLRELRDELAMAIIFITHDLGVIAQIADNVAVMYLGRIVERGPTRSIVGEPAHPYTTRLLEAIPRIDRLGTRLAAIPGTVPGPHERPTGCVFASRCDRHLGPRCDEQVPPLVAIGGVAHSAACFQYDGIETGDGGGTAIGVATGEGEDRNAPT